jgi:hypothetical protein
MQYLQQKSPWVHTGLNYDLHDDITIQSSEL